MLSIKHILFPVDLSAHCCDPAPFVASMAQRYGAKITLVSVSEQLCYAVFPEMADPSLISPELLLSDLRLKLDEIQLQEFEGLPLDRVAQLGEAAKSIIAFAGTHAVDLIMMPTHGHGTFRRLLLGSVTAKILHEAACPVWTATHTAEPVSREQIRCQSVLCAVDYCSYSEGLMKWAAEFATDAGAELHLAHVIGGMQGLPSHQKDREFQGSISELSRQSIGELQQTAGIEAPLSILSGGVAESISEEAKRCAADVVIIGRGAIREPFGRLRTHVYGIVRQTLCPVLSIPL